MSTRLTGCCASVVLALLGACGGGVGSTPAPIAGPSPTPSPTPSPSPTPTEVLRPEAIALKSSQPFVTYGVTETNALASAPDPSWDGTKDSYPITDSQPGRQDQTADFRYDQATGNYSMTFPDGGDGHLVLEYLNGSWGQPATSTGHIVNGPAGDLGVLLTMVVPSQPDYKYSYSHFGDWTKTVTNPDNSAIKTYGLFVYGQETAAAGVPRSGSATYLGEIVANSPYDAWQVGGKVELNFDFANSTLAGYIHPIFDTNGWYPTLDYDYGRFDFTQTVYSAGSARYSGAFARDGVVVAGSWFDGSLTGPNGEEAIGRFVAPFNRVGLHESLTGIWIAKGN